MSKSRWIALAIIGLVVLGVAATLLVKHRNGVVRVALFPVYWKRRADLLAELQPVVLKNCTLKRFGSANDGGYLLCENLSEGIHSAYSYGVGPNDEFGCDVSKRYNVPVHQYDCFDPARPKCKDGIFVFHNECIAPQLWRDKDGRAYDTLQNQIAKNLDTGKRLIVKIDVEGAEWGSLLATPDAVLDQIDQMPMELHGVNEQRFLELVRRLKQKFYLVNLHFNNDAYACTLTSAPLPAWVYQVLWVNKRLGILDESAPTPTPISPLNAPDDPDRPDCQLYSRMLKNALFAVAVAPRSELKRPTKQTFNLSGRSTARAHDPGSAMFDALAVIQNAKAAVPPSAAPKCGDTHRTAVLRATVYR